VRAAVYHGRRDVRVGDVPEPPEPAEGEVMLEVSTGSLCGTDLGEFLHGPKMIPLTTRSPASGHLGPVIIGHEFAGRVVAHGTGVDSLGVGTRVVAGAASWCGECRWCRQGRVNLCRDYFVFGLHANGGFADYINVPATMCCEVPPACSDQAAPIAQPLAVALHALRRAGARAGDSVVVIGAGGIGALIVAGAAAAGLDPLIAVDVERTRLESAETLGASTVLDARTDDVLAVVRSRCAGDGADLVIEASGTPAGLDCALACVRRGGRVALVGLQAGPVELDAHRLVVNEIELVSSNGLVCRTDLPAALDLVASSDVASIVTGRVIRLENVVSEGLIAMAEGRTGGKVVVCIDR
jgi:(R,R)-butanediol dehydrogenase/meso-butanediol dehydrogenase/diacetyl reductase